MLLYQAVLLSLCLSINAHQVRGNRFGGGGSGSGNGSSSSTSAPTTASSFSTTDTAAAASSSSASSESSTNQASSGEATLLSGNIQPASNSDGGAVVEAGQSPSITDPNNFINFCSGKNTTDGFQVVTGSCNGIVMGDIPSQENMISSIITNPAPGENLQANTAFTVNLQVTNLNAGTFTNPLTTYYSAPQQLKNGNIIGHTHITIQSLGNNIATTTPPDPKTFAFFKGVDDAGDGKGGLSAAVAGGLPAGAYRVCTMTSASNHQPVLMPVAQRGAQDDCTKFTVGANTGSSAAVGGTASSSVASGSTQSSSSSSSTAAAAAASSATAVSSGSGNTTTSSSSRRGGRHGGKFTVREFIA